jgi:hypothetical protein
MEEKQNKLLLASAVFGALFVAVIIICWVFAVSEIRFKEFNFITQQEKISVLPLVALQLLMAIITFSFVFNLIGWVNGSNRHILIAGILYILSFNLVSAFLCLRVYFKEKRKIENKLLFYTMIFTYVLCIPFIVLMETAMVLREGESPLIYPHTVYFLFTIGTGLILNLYAWKTGNNKAKIMAGIAYILGLFSVISGVICFISGRDLFKAIKNKLLFYAMVFALAWIAMLIVSVFAGSEEATLPMLIYMLATGIAGFFINYFAWKTNNKKVKIIAGIVYILGAVIIPAILCFISCKDNRKLSDAEGKKIQP